MNRNLVLWTLIVGGFIAAGLIALFYRLDKLAGVGLVVIGVAAALFARDLTSAQHELADRPYIPDHWKDVRPLTFQLWGIGVALVGILWVFL